MNTNLGHAKVGGPEFRLETDRVVIGLGHTERRQLAKPKVNAYKESGLFDGGIEVVTRNMLDSKLRRKAMKSLFAGSLADLHSAALMEVPPALQVVAHNPPEGLNWVEAFRRAFGSVAKDEIEQEHDAVNDQMVVDISKAGLQIIGSPITSLRTVKGIHQGYSGVEDLIARADDFPAGRAIVHGGLDGFKFNDLADMERAALNGITTVELPDMHHNEMLAAPRRVIAALTPVVYPTA